LNYFAIYACQPLKCPFYFLPESLQCPRGGSQSFAIEGKQSFIWRLFNNPANVKQRDAVRRRHVTRLRLFDNTSAKKNLKLQLAMRVA
jgi:hypothetical protein